VRFVEEKEKKIIKNKTTLMPNNVYKIIKIDITYKKNLPVNRDGIRD